VTLRGDAGPVDVTVSGRTSGGAGAIPDTATPLQTGVASWYGGKFHGRTTANGETFNKWDHTAAHRTLPFGTIVLVQHRRTNQWVKVRINDRGPFVKGRIIDLARGAATHLGMMRTGTAPVRLYVLGEKPGGVGETAPEGGTYTIQVGSFEHRHNALRVKSRLSSRFDHVKITMSYDQHHRVRVGRFPSRAGARASAKSLHGMGFDTWIVLESR